MWKEALQGLLKEVRGAWNRTIGEEEVPEQTLVLSLPSQKVAAFLRKEGWGVATRIPGEVTYIYFIITF